jgi:hypothetical protein
MRKFSIPWKSSPREELERALEISQWCKDMGLEHNLTYHWHFDSANQATIFIFKESMGSAFLLRWA